MITLARFRAGIGVCWVAVGAVVVLVETRDVSMMLALYVWLAIFVLMCWSAFVFRKLWSAVPAGIRTTIALGTAVVLAHLSATVAIVLTKGWSPEGLIYDWWVATYLLVALSAFVAPALLIAALFLARGALPNRS